MPPWRTRVKASLEPPPCLASRSKLGEIAMHASRMELVGLARSLATSGLLAASLGTATAQPAYPSRPVHILLGFPAGSGADVLARYFVTRLQGVSGKPFVLENKPGAAGSVAVGLAAKAKPDGYTLLIGTSSTMVGAQFFLKNVPFDPVRDFVPLGSLVQSPFVVLTAGSTPVAGLAGLTSALKARARNRFAYSNQIALLAAQYYKTVAGFPADAVPYKLATDAFPDLQNGLLELMVADATTSRQPIGEGKLKALAVTTAARQPALPGVPTMREQGFPEADFSSWSAVYAPAGTDRTVIATLLPWVKEASQDAGTAAFLLKSGNAPLGDDGPAVVARLQRETAAWAPLVKAAGIERQ